MKKLNALNNLILVAIVIITIILFVQNNSYGASGWTVNGVATDDICSLSGVLSVASGAATSAIVHCMGHHIVAGALGVWLDQRGLSEWKPDNISSFQNDAIDIGGFIVQMSVGSILTALVPGKFSAGYNAWSAIEVTTYPLIFGIGNGSGDIGGGLGDAAYFILTGWSIINLNGGN
jgi:hypothetical protein